ncbi:MAG: sporulation protein YunB [Firmicutes bacterium]|jgi:sporulation protein YunB|nr:sporulation protein YunB [Bacillota bacterium]
MRAGRRQGQRRFKVVLLSLFLIIISCASWAAWVVRTTVEPNMEDIGKMRARVLVTRMVTKAINDQFQQETDAEKLIIRKTNDKGELEMIQADTKAINLLITEISKELQEEYANMDEEITKVPIGSLLDSKVLSQTWPCVRMKVIPLSVSGMDFKTEFETQGINQTKYKVYITLKSEVKMLAPFSAKTFRTSNTILLAEAVIIGNVPQSYVQVPKEDILDVT